MAAGFDARAARAAYGALCRPMNAGLMQALRLDVVYERAVGDELMFRGADDRIEIVTDFVGGYGATIVGHYHPAVTGAAEDALDRRAPFAAQASIRGAAAELAQRLHDVLRDRLGADYAVLLASTGAEAAEMALKHSEMRWRARIDTLRQSHERAVTGVARGVRERRYRLDPALGLAESELASVLRARFAAVIDDARPVLIALERGFHGKTIGALSLTYGTQYRDAFARLLLPVCFVPDDAAGLEHTVREHALNVPWPVVGRDSIVRIEARSVSAVVAMFAEPLQGEGGVRPVSAAMLRRARALADEHEFALILDEIQCGMGRTGTFLYSEQLGVQGDAYLLSKSLGGGLAKISALVVRKDRFEEEFGLVHSSTFGEDDPSAAVALATLRVLFDEGARPMDRARRIGERLMRGLREIAARYPDVVRDVRGAGLMIGVELGEPHALPDGAIRALAEQDMLGYVVAGHVLHEHRLRVMPCMSAPRVLRLEPSAFISKAAIEELLRAFERTCELLSAGDAYGLLKYLVGLERTERPEVPVTPKRELEGEASAEHRVGFVGYFIDVEQMPKWDPSFARFSKEEREELVRAVFAHIDPSYAGSAIVRSALGSSVELRYYGLFVDSLTFYENLRGGQREVLRAQVEQATRLAKDDGCSVVGFGGLTSVVTGNCRDLSVDGVALTTGNSLTVAMCIEAAAREASAMGIELAQATLGAVGAGGNIGTVYCLRMSDEVARVVLVGREGQEAVLVPLMHRLYERAYARLLAASTHDGAIAVDAPLRRGLSRVLHRHEGVRVLLTARAPVEGIGASIAALFGSDAPVSITSDLSRLREASVVLGASNAPHALVEPEHLGQGRVLIVDVAVPGDAHPSIGALSPRVRVISGGAVDLGPANAGMVPQAPLADGHLYACATEALVLGLEGRAESYSTGAVRLEQVEEIYALALRHGFTPAKRDLASALAPLKAIA